DEFAHVREVEQCRVRAHSAMFRNDSFVLDRHLVSSERHHLRSQRDVPLVERGAPKGRCLGGHHAASAAASARSRMSRWVSKESRRRASSSAAHRTSSYSWSCSDTSPPVCFLR